MTGVLLLPIKTDLGSFYRKRIGRILTALVFWSLVLPLLYYVYLNHVTVSQSPAIAPENFTLGATLHKLWTFVFNFTFDTTPLWYLTCSRGSTSSCPSSAHGSNGPRAANCGRCSAYGA